MSPAVVAQIRKRVGGFELDLSLELNSGVTVLFGPSGAGKTLTLSAIAGAVRPDEGRVAFGSEIMFDAVAGLDRPLSRRGVGWVFQESRLFPHLSVRANLLYGLARAGGRPRRFDYEPVVEALGLQRLLARRPASLSGGEAQRVGLGRALLSQPRVLLMDEPLASIDQARREEILRFMQKALAGSDLPVLYVTHSPAERDQLADAVVTLKDGREVPSAATSARPRAQTTLRGRLSSDPSPDGAVLVQAAGALWRVHGAGMSGAARRGDAVELAVNASDVVLALTPASTVLACARLEARILDLEGLRSFETLVRLAADGVELEALVSTAVIEAEGLQAGRTVVALIRQAHCRLAPSSSKGA